MARVDQQTPVPPTLGTGTAKQTMQQMQEVGKRLSESMAAYRQQVQNPTPTFQQRMTALGQSVAGVGTKNFAVPSAIQEGIQGRRAEQLGNVVAMDQAEYGMVAKHVAAAAKKGDQVAKFLEARMSDAMQMADKDPRGAEKLQALTSRLYGEIVPNLPSGVSVGTASALTADLFSQFMGTLERGTKPSDIVTLSPADGVSTPLSFDMTKPQQAARANDLIRSGQWFKDTRIPIPDQEMVGPDGTVVRVSRAGTSRGSGRGATSGGQATPSQIISGDLEYAERLQSIEAAVDQMRETGGGGTGYRGKAAEKISGVLGQFETTKGLGDRLATWVGGASVTEQARVRRRLNTVNANMVQFILRESKDGLSGVRISNEERDLVRRIQRLISDDADFTQIWENLKQTAMVMVSARDRFLAENGQATIYGFPPVGIPLDNWSPEQRDRLIKDAVRLKESYGLSDQEAIYYLRTRAESVAR